MKAMLMNFIGHGSQARSNAVRKNVLYMFILKGGSICINLLLVPLTINYLDAAQYGVWLVVSSLVSWVSLFDIGIGNGLRNRVASLIAVGEEHKIKYYVSSAYGFVAAVSVVVFCCVFIISPHVEWQAILNAPVDNDYINFVVNIVFGAFCLNLVLQIVNIVLDASQQAFKASLITFVGQLGSLVTLFILSKFVPGNLIFVVSLLVGVPVLVTLGATLFFFSKSLSKFKPHPKLINFQYGYRLVRTGSLFFLIQIGALILFQTDNLIITHLFGPEEVTKFNISYKAFSLVSMLFVIFITPFWSAFTDAYVKEDFAWIRTAITRLRLVWFMLSVSALFILIFSGNLYRLWVGDVVQIPWMLSVSMFIYIVVFMWQTLHVYFLNGAGKLKLQFVVVVCGALINVPLAVTLGAWFGLHGVVVANAIVVTLMSVIFTLQYHRIIKPASKHSRR